MPQFRRVRCWWLLIAVWAGELLLHTLQDLAEGMLAKEPQGQSDRTTTARPLDPHSVGGVALDFELRFGEAESARVEKAASAIIGQDDGGLSIWRDWKWLAWRLAHGETSHPWTAVAQWSTREGSASSGWSSSTPQETQATTEESRENLYSLTIPTIMPIDAQPVDVLGEQKTRLPAFAQVTGLVCDGGRCRI